MYQQQLSKLLVNFNELSGNRYRLNRLFNDSDYRNQALVKESSSSSNCVNLLVRQIQMYEDLLGHELRVDVPRKPKLNPSPLFGLILFAVSGLTVIGGSVFAYEEIKHNRTISQAEKDRK